MTSILVGLELVIQLAAVLLHISGRVTTGDLLIITMVAFGLCEMRLRIEGEL